MKKLFIYLTLIFACIACDDFDAPPQINNLLGDYKANYIWFGGLNSNDDFIAFNVAKRKDEPEKLNVKLKAVGGWEANMVIKYDNGKISLEKQVVQEVQGTFNLVKIYHIGSGKAFGDSLILEGEYIEDPIISIDRTFFRYIAKKIK